MARTKNAVPSYLLHQSSGQARVRIDGRDILLPGPFGSEESRVAYGQLIARHGSGLPPIDPMAKAKSADPEGDPALLNAKMKALEDIRDIWGVNAPKELKHSGEVGPATALIPITAPNRREAIRMQLQASLALLEKQESAGREREAN